MKQMGRKWCKVVYIFMIYFIYFIDKIFSLLNKKGRINRPQLIINYFFIRLPGSRKDIFVFIY